MFFLGPYYGSDSEHCKYEPVFFDSLSYPISLSVQNPDMFDPSRHYSFGTNRHEIEVTPDEIADIASAMHAAREAFLQGFDTILLTCSDHELRTALGRSSESFPEWVWREERRIVRSVRKEVERGRLIFVPTHEDLRACVKAIQENRRKRPASSAQQSERFDPRSAAQQMYGRPRQMPQNLNGPPYLPESASLGDAQPFEYQPDGLLDQGQDDAGIFLTPAEEAGCELQYDLDMAECSAYAAMDKGYWGVCKERAMQRYSNCLGRRFVG